MEPAQALIVGDMILMMTNQLRNLDEMLMQHRMFIRQGPQLETPDDLQAIRANAVEAMKRGQQPQPQPTKEQQRQAMIHNTLAQAKAIANALAHNSAQLNGMLNGEAQDNPPGDAPPADAPPEPGSNGLHLTE